MKVILTLDYELFFGTRVGTLRQSIIETSNILLEVLNRYHAKAVFFVDATYLLRMNMLKEKHPALQGDYEEMVNHIRDLEREGHQIQLHIHPHWLDSSYENGAWSMDVRRYRLIDWSKDDAYKIIASSVCELNQHLSHDVFAFRAGGWCIQPFHHIAKALIDHGIQLDSTVFKHGKALSESHAFDFTEAPDLTHWKFDSDPCVASDAGLFKEVAISSMRVSPLFFWRFAFVKIFGDKSLHGSHGDGVAIKNSRGDLLRMLTCYSNSVVSIDGYKSSCLLNEYRKAKSRGDDYFVVIGHPKALSNYALNKVDEWLSTMAEDGVHLRCF